VAKRNRRRIGEKSVVPNPTSLQLVIAFVVMFFIGGLFSGSFWSDVEELKLFIAGGYLWVLALGFTFLLGVFYYSKFIIPADWHEGVLLLVADLWNGWNKLWLPAHKQATLDKREQQGSMRHLPASFHTVRAGILDSHFALAIVKNNEFSRAIGPGYVRLAKGELVHGIIDLRPQFCMEKTSATTRDGIQLKLQVSVVYHINRLPEDESDPNIPYVYDPDSIFLASYATSLAEGKAPKEWVERILPATISMVIAEVSQYTLDDLFSTRGNVALIELKTQIKEQVFQKFAPMGIHILNVGVGKFDILNKHLDEQRFENWKVAWQAKMNIAKAKCDAEIARLRNDTNAKKQQDLLEHISERIKKVQTSGNIHIEDVMLIQIVQMLEKSNSNNTRPITLPKTVLDSVFTLQQLIQSKSPIAAKSNHISSSINSSNEV
jgi:regulator of protease activity HflC (stomatin/prohibitin superfamily)